MNDFYLGLDTSAYTTSVAVIDDDGEIIFDSRKVLKVDKNKRGLRQQEAVFQHINNLPFIFKELTENIEINKIKFVSASVKPRNIEGSYMPVFQVGKGQAYVVSKILNVPFKQFSHQEGHIGAGMLNSPIEKKDKFLAFHISGGTTELLLVDNHKDNLHIEIIGGTLDISFGQLIDRIGVKLGLTFPCGKEMDIISEKGNIIKEKISFSIQNTWGNFSGYENMFNGYIDSDKYKEEDIVKTLFYTIYKSINKMIVAGCKLYDINEVLLIGGVASNSYIRKKLKEELEKQGIFIYFADKKYCSDNSIGVAYLGKIKSGHMWGI